MKFTLFDSDNWREISATLLRNKTRTFLTGFGIFWGVAMLAMLTGGARGAEDMLRRNFAGFVTNSAGFVPNLTTMPYKGFQKGRSWALDTTDLSALRRNFPDLDAIAPIYQRGQNATLSHGRYYASGSLVGVNPDYAKVTIPVIYAGRFLNEADERGERKVAVLGKNLASSLFAGADPLGQSVQVDGIAYTVVGVDGNMSDASIGARLDDSVLIPASTFRRTHNWGDRVDFLMLTARQGVAMGPMADKVAELLRRRHNVNPGDTSAMWVMNIAHEFETVNKLFLGVTLIAWFIGFSTLLAGIIGIGNIMWVIVKERTQEIGIRRAIGARPRDITAQVLCEGTALTLMAGMGGIVFATIALAIAQYLCNRPDDNGLMPETAHFQMSLTGAVGILCLFTLLGILAGLIPSLKTMKIKPVEALNSK